MPNHHTLKTDAAAFDAVVRGEKNFEVRKDDRAFQAGDTVTLEYFDAARTPFGPPRLPWEPERNPVTFRIGFVLRGGQYGIEPGYVAFSLMPDNTLEPVNGVGVVDDFAKAR